MKTRKLLVSSLLLATFSTNSNAITIDGDLSDWGVSRNGNASDWTPTANAGIQYTVEDQHEKKLDPGYGGQLYDAEAIYAYKNDTTLFIALATGHNPETANNPNSNSFGAGDFAIDFGKDGIYELGINIKPSWDDFGVAAGVYKNVKWDYSPFWADDPLSGYVKSEHPTSIVGGDWLGDANLSISGPQTGFGDWKDDTHYFYEMSLELKLLRLAGWNNESFNIHWTQNCANDSIIVDPPASVPTPSILMLLLAGLIGIRITKKSGKRALV
jgi:hypothetical protein